MRLPDGYIVETAIPEAGFAIIGEMNDKGVAVKGYRLETPNLNNAGNHLKNDLYLRLVGYLASQSEDIRIQFRYTRDADYRDILERYRAETAKTEQPWNRRCREGLLNRYEKMLTNRQLRREYVHVYVAFPLKRFTRWGFQPESKRDRKRFESEIETAFQNTQTDLRQFLNLPVHSLTHLELFREYYRAVNKSAVDLEIDYEQLYSPCFYDMYSCEYAKPSVTDENCASFHADGYYHNILTLHDFPKTSTTPFYGNKLLQNHIQNLTIAVNLEPLETEKVIEAKQKQWKRVRADLAEDESEVAVEAGLDELTAQIYRLGKGEESPYRVEYMIHVWNQDLRQLQSDTAVLKQAATGMFTSLDMYELGLQAEYNFLKTIPGNLYLKRKDAALDCMHQSLASLLPISASFTGKGAEGNIIFEGDHGNLMTISLFESGTPQHMLCLGQTGAGKSVNFVSILSQSFYDFGKIVIIEEGGSYFNLTRIWGHEAQYIVIDPDADLTLNYYDTGGLPLTPAQIEFVVTFLVAMCGESGDLEKIQDRSALLTPYVTAVYNDAYLEWRGKHRVELEKAARMAITIEHMMPKMSINRNTALDAYFDLQEILRKRPEEWDAFEQETVEVFSAQSVRDLNDYIINDPELLRNIAYSMMKSADMPYHSQLVEAIRETAFSHHDKTETNRLSSRLAVYSVESGKGCLFDGETSIDLSKKWLHIELGKMAQSSPTLKALVGIVINNLVKNQIVNLPRSVRKLYLFEEAARFLTIPGAAEIMKQSYAQFRKFNCVAVTVTQSIAQMEGSGVGQIIMTQSKSFLFLKNTDTNELERLTNYLPISQDAIRTITEFPSPEHLAGRKYSSFLYFAQRPGWPLVGVGRNYASPALLAAAATSGDLHGKLTKILKELEAGNPEMSFCDQLVEAAEILGEDHQLYRILNRIAESGDDHIKQLVLDAKIAAHNYKEEYV